MKNAVIVGGSQGIGLAVAQRLVQNMNKTTVVSRKPCAVAEVVNVPADVTDTYALKSAFARISDIDVLIYCAGFSLAAPLVKTDAKDYKYLFDVNLFGAAECIKLALPALERSEDPRIILLSSSGAIAPNPYDAFYSASKAGLLSLAATLDIECPHIKTTAVVIGGTQTQFSFKRKVYDDCGEYAEDLKAASDALIRMEQTGYSAAYVARKITDIIDRKNPPPVATVGCKNKLTLFLYKILPQRLKLFALRKKYGIK